jgi:hypothetical protein
MNLRTILSILLSFILFSCAAQKSKSKDSDFVKEVYGNPGTLLKAGYRFDSLGMNAVFVRSSSLTSAFYCAWYPQEHDSALHRILGIDVRALAAHADVLAPMLFHRMMGKDTDWVSEYVAWLGGEISKKNLGTKIWPIVQADSKGGPVSPDEFRKVMINGSRALASGIIMFADQSLLDDLEKLRVMKALYRK